MPGAQLHPQAPPAWGRWRGGSAGDGQMDSCLPPSAASKTGLDRTVERRCWAGAAALRAHSQPCAEEGAPCLGPASQGSTGLGGFPEEEGLPASSINSLLPEGPGGGAWEEGSLQLQPGAGGRLAVPQPSLSALAPALRLLPLRTWGHAPGRLCCFPALAPAASAPRKAFCLTTPSPTPRPLSGNSSGLPCPQSGVWHPKLPRCPQSWCSQVSHVHSRLPRGLWCA